MLDFFFSVQGGELQANYTLQSSIHNFSFCLAANLNSESFFTFQFSWRNVLDVPENAPANRVHRIIPRTPLRLRHFVFSILTNSRLIDDCSSSFVISVEVEESFS